MRFVSPARKKSPNRSSKAALIARRSAGFLALAVLATGAGCSTEQLTKSGKIIGDYLNLRNSFLNPGEVGRFDKAQPFGEARFVQLPILDTLNIVDEQVDHWANAQDPLASDLVPDNKEYVFGIGDSIGVTVFELITPGQPYERNSQITETGSINIQSLGNIPVIGLTPTQLEEKIKQIIIDKGIMAAVPGPQVTVTLLGSRQRIFSILGAVSAPGSYNIIANDFRLLDALALARDVQVQPGMDYLFVIRQTNPTGDKPVTPATTNAATPKSNPADIIGDIEHSTTNPLVPAPTAPAPTAPATVPDTGPASVPAKSGAMAPSDSGAIKLARDLPPGFEMKVANAIVVAESSPKLTAVDTDLDAAASGATAPAATATAPAPAAASSSAPAATTEATTPPASTTAATVPATRDTKELDAAMSQPDASNFGFVEGKLVILPKKNPTTDVAVLPPTTTVTTTMPTHVGPATDIAADISSQRVIRIPIQALREGVSRYNIVVRPGDVINIPGADPGEFYLMGHVSRPGVYTLTGRKVTLKQAVAAAGNLDGLAVPRRCDLIRRVGPNQEVTVQVDLQAIFDGEQPDIFIKPNDVLNVGTDAVVSFLAVTRNAYRASYGWGYVYDKNISGDNNNNSGN